jgi:predicted amidohydrolase YtcJ
MSLVTRCCALVAVLGLGAGLTSVALSSPEPADLVVRGAKIYTVDKAGSIAQALAVKDGRVVFVGGSSEAQAWIGPKTHVESLGGRLVLPGLIDAHIHPLDIADLDVCTLDDRIVTLAELSRFVAQCLAHYKTAPGAQLIVYQWNYAVGNQPDPQHRTLRAALDAASTTQRIQLLGDDGHHSAFNSLALAQAKDKTGKVVGLSKATLANEFSAYRALVGVDEDGEPNGAVNEDARYFINRDAMHYLALDEVLKVPERITQRLSSSGITAVLDAMASPEGMPVYDKLAADGHLTVRVTLAQYFDPSDNHTADGKVDYDGMLARAKQIRTKYANSPLIRADVVKMFADGGIEGNPFAVPPTLPDGAVLRPFLQPMFAVDPTGRATVTGYVDTAAPLCVEVREHPDNYLSAQQVGDFIKVHGYHPAQCTISSGKLQYEREVILEYAKRMHAAGFSLHIHTIGDRAARTAIDAIEAARAADGNSATRDALAHLQLADPADVARIGRDHLFVAFTYAWMTTEPDYDLMVIPFLQPVHGNTYAALHPAGSFYDSNSYPARAVKAAGGILTAGSDAPVDTREPRPFVNMAIAVTRRIPTQPALGPQQGITLPEVIEAYTAGGAQLLNIEKDAGSLEVGKSADFIVLDRDILALAAGGHPESVAEARVLSTWFQGKQVYKRAH